MIRINQADITANHLVCFVVGAAFACPTQDIPRLKELIKDMYYVELTIAERNFLDAALALIDSREDATAFLRAYYSRA